MKVDFGRDVMGSELLTVLEQAAKDTEGEYHHNHPPGREEKYLVLGSVREEIRYRLANPKITFPFTDLKTPFFESTKLAIYFGSSDATDNNLHYYGISPSHSHKIADIKIYVLGKATGLGWLSCAAFTCIPVIGWISLFKFFNRGLSILPRCEKEQVTSIYHQYFNKVSELLKSVPESA